jgi:hypothetical protein
MISSLERSAYLLVQVIQITRFMPSGVDKGGLERILQERLDCGKVGGDTELKGRLRCPQLQNLILASQDSAKLPKREYNALLEASCNSPSLGCLRPSSRSQQDSTLYVLSTQQVQRIPADVGKGEHHGLEWPERRTHP